MDDDDQDTIYFFSYFSFYRRYPIDNKCDCVGETFKSCHLEDPKSVCVGRAFRAYFYEFSDRLENKSQNQKPVSGEYGIYDTLCISVLLFDNGQLFIIVPMTKLSSLLKFLFSLSIF